MRVNNIGYVNFKGSEVENSEKGNINPPKETKEAPASISDALCTYGKAQVRMNGTSFTGNIRRDKQSDIKLKELTDEEFEKYKAKLGKKIKAMPNDVKKEAEIWFRCLNKTNIFLADKILSDERFCGNKNFMNNAGSIIRYTDSKEQTDARITIIDKILSDERFCGNKNFMNNAGSIIDWTDSKENADAKIRVIDKILSSPILHDNKYVMEDAGKIICWTDSKENANAKIGVMDKILSDEKLHDNRNVIWYAGDIISNTDSKEKADARIAIIDKILSDERLCGNKNFMENAGSIIYDTKSKMSADKAIGLIDKCDKEGFLDKNDFVSNLETLLTDTLKGTNE